MDETDICSVTKMNFCLDNKCAECLMLFRTASISFLIKDVIFVIHVNFVRKMPHVSRFGLVLLRLLNLMHLFLKQSILFYK